MDLNLIVGNLLNPPVMFFFLGVIAVLVKSNLELPEAMAKFFSMYLLFAIGFKGGVELYKEVQHGIKREHIETLIACSIMATAIPIYSFYILKLKLDVHNAAAIAASYGSVSAVTFVTAGSFLHNLNIEYGGFIVAGMALMESPAIIIGVLIDRLQGKEKGSTEEFSWKELFHEAFFSGSIMLLVGALIIGFITGTKGWEAEKPFADDMFKGFLSFFLLDMGLSSAKRLGDIKKSGFFLVSFGILMPLFNAAIGIGLAKFFNLPVGDALMFVVLCASASYIAVPAAIRLAIPQANPSLYLPMALAITFPFNVIVGIPLYFTIIKSVLG